MTPTSGFEISLLALQAIMFGIYFSVPTASLFCEYPVGILKPKPRMIV